MATKSTVTEEQEPLNKDILLKLTEMVKSVHYGSVTLIIQDGVIIQIDKNEKWRVKK